MRPISSDDHPRERAIGPRSSQLSLIRRPICHGEMPELTQAARYTYLEEGAFEHSGGLTVCVSTILGVRQK